MVSKQSQKEIELSLFNTAMGYTRRLNNILDMCAQSALELNAYQWYHLLRIFSTNIDNKTKPEDREALKRMFDTVLPEIHQHNENFNNNGISSISPKLYDQLDEIQKLAMRIADEAGLLVPTQQSIRSVFARGGVDL